MALVSDGYFVRVTVVDASGKNKSTLSYDVVAADIATAQANAAAIVGDLDPLTNGLVLSYSVGETFKEDTDIYGDVGSEVERKAAISVFLETGDKKHTLYIPAPDPALFLATQGEDKNKVDITNANLIAYLRHFTDETGMLVPGPDAIALVSDGEKIKPDNALSVPVIRSGKQIHRGSTQG